MVGNAIEKAEAVYEDNKKINASMLQFWIGKNVRCPSNTCYC